ESKRIRLTLAYIYFKTGRLDDSLQELNRILSADPGFLQARELRSVVSAQQQDFDQAIQDSRFILDKQPELSKIRFRLAQVLRRQGQLEEALDELRIMLGETPEMVPVLTEMVRIYSAQGAYQTGLDLLDRWIEQKPDVLQLGLLKGNLLLNWNKLNQAEDFLLRLHEQHPDSELPLLLLVQVDLTRGNPEKAAETCRRAMAVNPENPAPYLRLAGIYNRLGDWQQSIDVYQELLKVRPSFAPAMNDLAYLFAVQGINLDKAMELGQKALELRPGDPNVRDTLGFVAYQKGATRVAQRYLREAIEMQPERPVFHYHLGQVLAAQEQYSQAGQSLEKSLELGLDGEMKAEAELLLDEIAGRSDIQQQVADLLQEGDIDRALEIVREAQAKAPQNPELSFLLGRVYQEKGSLLMSEQYLNKAVELDQNKGVYRLHLGRVLFEEQAFDRAREQLEQAVQLGLDPEQQQQAERLLQEMADG
ncbi:MAG: tetratricopeptide repeat protein, partial [Desulfohalobiaceae bacterium]|nr:tetratricopeptide repeat protein [Desulfohalobiaceae bacterium]